MELRTPNVERVYLDTVKCVIQDKIGVYPNFIDFKNDIKDMIFQIRTSDEHTFVLNQGHIRKDGEQWTPYLQPVIMLVQLAKRAGYVSYEGQLKPNTIIKVNEI